MEAKTKKRVVIWTSVAVILGVGGYFLYKYLKDSGKIGKKGADAAAADAAAAAAAAASSGGGGGGAVSSATPTAAQVALATAYRIWANSTDELNKKYGKKSKYDLDASSSTPYNSFFEKSYAAGKADYEASLKQPTATNVKQDQIEQITKIAARYKVPIEAHSKGGLMISLFFGASLQGVEKAFRVRLYEKNPNNGVKDSNGHLSWVLFDSDWSRFSAYENLSYTAKSMGK